jgi:hypothetical protein
LFSGQEEVRDGAEREQIGSRVQDLFFETFRRQKTLPSAVRQTLRGDTSR